MGRYSGPWTYLDIPKSYIYILNISLKYRIFFILKTNNIEIGMSRYVHLR